MTTDTDTIPHPGRDYSYSYGMNGDSKKALEPIRQARWEPVAELDSGSGYDWGVLAVWRDRTNGRLVWDDDAGCSCYGPWESSTYDNLRDVSDYRSFRDVVLNWADYEHECSVSDAMTFLDKIRREIPA